MMKQFVGVIFMIFMHATIAQKSILPTPSFIENRDGNLSFPGGEIRIEKDILPPEELLFFRSQFSLEGLELKESERKRSDIQFDWDKDLLPEAYKLDVDTSIQISAHNHAGRFYGLLSLLQLIHYNGVIPEIHKVRLEDAPQFSWRGLHLDVSRHFFAVAEVKRFIDLMALYKYNTFHWHLTDDQGWRIEIKKYLELTTTGGFRDSTLIGHFTDTPRQYQKEEYGGFYTQEEIREVIAYAANRHITVVPEIEMPGHSRAALAAYPELSCTEEKQPVPGLWGVFDDIYCSKEESIQFLQEVLDEVLELFPSEYIHIGGDEAPKSRWKKCKDCRKVMETNDLGDTHALQSYFIGRMDEYLTEHGRKLIGWDEILEGGLTENAAVMSWRGEAGGIEAAKQGHYVVMSPTTYCYFDYYQSSHESEPLAIGGFLPLEKVYEYTPIPDALTPKEAEFVLGGQANVWTEYISNFNQVEYMVYPRAIALMQSLWCQSKPDYKTFLQVYLDKHEPFLAKRKVNFSKSIHIPKLQIDRIKNGVAYSWKGIDTSEIFQIGTHYTNGAIAQGYLKSGAPIAISKGGQMKELLLQTQNFLLKYDIFVSDALGAKVDFSTTPHPKYNNNGGLNLVDGILGSKIWKGDQWLGFRDKKIEIIVALDTIQSRNNFNRVLNKNGSWIYIPEYVGVTVSNDKENWREIGVLELAQDGHVVRPTIELNTQAKYLKIEVVPKNAIPEGNGGAGSTPWTFIDEIQLFTK